MRKSIITLASSAAVGVLALVGLQGSAQAYEYRHHVTRFEHRGHDYDRFHFRFFSHHRPRSRSSLNMRTRGRSFPASHPAGDQCHDTDLDCTR